MGTSGSPAKVVAPPTSSKRARTLFLVGVVTLCGVSIALALLGVDFSGLSPVGPVLGEHRDAGVSSGNIAALHAVFPHTLLGWSAVNIALLLAFLAFSYFLVNRDVTVALFGAAFLGTALIDAFHTLTTFYQIEVVSHAAAGVPTWELSRIFNAGALAVAAMAALYVLSATRNQRVLRYVLGFVGLMLAAVAVLTYLWATVDASASTGAARPNWNPIHLVSLGIYIVLALFLLPKFFPNNAAPFVFSLQVSMIPQIVVQVVTILGARALYDGWFIPAHLIKIIAYVVPLVGLVWSFLGAQQALRDSERRQQSIVETMVDGLITITDKGLIADFNRAAEQMFGYQSVEVVGSNINKLMPEPYRSEHDGYLASYQRTGEAKIIGVGREVTGMRKDGTTFDMHLSVGQMRVSGNTMYSGIVRDITEAKATAAENRRYAYSLERLHELTALPGQSYEQRMQALLELGRELFGLPVGCVSCLVGQHCQLEHVSGPEGSPPVGTALLLGDTFCSTTLEKGLPFAIDDARKAGFTTDPCHTRFGLVSYLGSPLVIDGKPYGTLNFSSTSVRPRRFGGDDYAIIQLLAERVCTEITEHRAGAELAESAERMRSIFNTVVDGIITVNSRSEIESFNPAAERLFGYRADEAIGKNVRMLMPNSFIDWSDLEVLDYLLGERTEAIGTGREVEGRRKFGSTFPMELSVSEMNLSGRRVFTGIMRDITERKKVDRIKNQFISTVSHELRTPLTAIRGALGLVLGKEVGSLSERGRRMLETASRNSDRLTFLINDILDLEKIEAGKLEFDMQPLDIYEVARRAIEENEAYGQSFKVGIKLVSDTGSKLTVRGDEFRLLQVFANLISNAVKFSPEGSNVAIKIMCRDNLVRVSVMDNGPGIPKNFRSKIFGRFAQADSSDSRDKGGTGLGLTISRAIVEAHGGNIDFKTLEGIGSEFYFDLPEYQESIVGEADDRAIAKALICEDNYDVAQILSHMLAEQGLSSDIAATGQAALDMASNNDYELMLLDLALPDIDGLELLRMVRARTDTGQLPVIVVSAYASESKISTRTDPALAVIDWVQKPIDPRRLKTSVETALQQRQNSGSQRPRILHVEDDEGVVNVTRELLSEYCDYDCATSLAQARSKLSGEPYSLMILDLALPDGHGGDLLTGLENRPSTIIFSGNSPSKEITKSVSTTLTKSTCSNEQLVSTVRRVLQSKHPV